MGLKHAHILSVIRPKVMGDSQVILSHVLEGGSHMTPREEKGIRARVPMTPQLLN